jgi:hypothetical protein
MQMFLFTEKCLLQGNDPENSGIFSSLKKAVQERDAHGKQWFTEANTDGVLVNMITGGMYLQEENFVYYKSRYDFSWF